MPDSSDQQDVRSLIQSGFRYALSLTHHRHDAEDLIQQACLKILRTHNDLVSKGYLFATIRNLFIDSGRRRSECELTDAVRERIIDSTANHVSQIGHRMDVAKILGSLRPQEREALYLSCVEGYTTAEIAELTGQPRGTVLSHLSRAKKRAQETQIAVDREEVI